MAPRVVAARARPSYTLWVQFADGLEGVVYLGNLLEIGAFALWKHPGIFEAVTPGADGKSVWWEAGIRLDGDVLWDDVRSTDAASAERRKDPGFQAFMMKFGGK